MSRKSLIAVVSSALLSMVLAAPVLGPPTASAQSKGSTKSAKAADAPAKFKGRLPPYYKDIVDETQKQKIYQLQGSYAEKIAALQEQLDKLTDERDTAVENVLSAAQKEKLKVARDGAGGKKKKSAEPAETSDVVVETKAKQ